MGGDDMNEVFTVAEAAAMLKVDPSTLRQRLRAGILGGFRIGTDWRITKADLDAFIERARNDYRTDDDAEDRAALARAGSGDFEDWQAVKTRNGL
jgi:excisionase family DNA binding protein